VGRFETVKGHGISARTQLEEEGMWALLEGFVWAVIARGQRRMGRGCLDEDKRGMQEGCGNVRMLVGGAEGDEKECAEGG
jgi:hypothetical protein